jgi:hypothetical protein
MANTVPFEVIAAAPITLYRAPVATSFPTLDTATPLSPWTKVGSSGDLNYDDGGGVVVEHPQNLSPWRALGDSGSRKVFRQDEDCKVKVKVVDLTLEQYTLALNGNSVTTVAPGVGTVGYRKIGLSRGLSVDTKALLLRILVSPYGALFIGQYQFPRCASTGSPSIVFKKTEPAGLDLEFMSLVDPNASSDDERFGTLLWQDLDATT